MTPLTFLMPWLAHGIGTVFQVMGMVLPVIRWLARSMARNEKVMGFLAGPFSGTCSGLVPVFESYHKLLCGPSANQHIYMNLDGSALSVVPDQRDRGRYRPDIGRRACDGCQRRGNDSAPLRSGVQLLLLAYWAPQRVLMRWYVGAVTPGTSGRSGTEFDILRHRGHWRSSGCSPSWRAEGSTGGPTRG